jgi:hypothetical protein
VASHELVKFPLQEQVRFAQKVEILGLRSVNDETRNLFRRRILFQLFVINVLSSRAQFIEWKFGADINVRQVQE